MTHPRFPYSGGRHAHPQPATAALVTDGLCVCYPGTQRYALRDASVRAGRGVRVALVGPNGAGKSTLLKAVAGLLPVAGGTVSIYGNAVGACHHRVAYLPQRGDIDWTFPVPVHRFVLAGRYVHLGWFRRPRKADHEIAARVLDRLGLGELADRQIGKLSGGQQQRALLARALAQEADLLLLDEPLNAVDADTREVIYDVLTDLKALDKTLVVATHDLGRLADAFDSVIHLRDGRVVPADAPEREMSWAG
jgi:manganese/zinc/iron transport system ATP- binding protein